MLDPFYLKSDEESKKLISDYWESAEYLVKIRVITKAYGYSITKIESQPGGVNTLWRKLGVKKQKEVYEDQYKYQLPGQ